MTRRRTLRRGFAPALATGPAPVLAAGLIPALAALPVLGQDNFADCTAPRASVRLDHVPVAVSDLDSAVAEFEGLGFTVKPGSLHPNGLANAHIEFADGTSLELITAPPDGGGRAGDALSAWYRRLIEAGGGGAFLSLRAGRSDDVYEILRSLGLEPRRTDGRAFDWVSFAEGHPLHNIFFIDYAAAAHEAPAFLRHANGATGLVEARVETAAPDGLGELLRALGAASCGPVAGEERGTAYGVANGTIVLVPAGDDPFARVRTVTIRAAPQAAADRTQAVDPRGLRPARGIILRFVFR